MRVGPSASDLRIYKLSFAYVVSIVDVSPSDAASPFTTADVLKLSRLYGARHLVYKRIWVSMQSNAFGRTRNFPDSHIVETPSF